MTRTGKRTSVILAAIVAGTLSIQSIRGAAEYRHALDGHRALYPQCTNIVLTGCTHTNWVCNTHHRTPLAKAFWLYATATNLVTYCDHESETNRARTNGCHYVAHGRKWR